MKLPGQIAAAIEILSDIEARRRPVADALKDWGLSHRFAGSGDRAIIGNLVYDALRRRLSLAWQMDGDTPWHLAIGAALLDWGQSVESLNAAFAGDAHSPPSIPDTVALRRSSVRLSDAPAHVRADVPQWIMPAFEAAFGADAVAEGEVLAERPPLDLRVNLLKADREKVAAQLARLGAAPTPFSPVGLRIPPADGARRHPNVQAEEGFQRGRFEVQDEGSQVAALLVGAKAGEQALDLCAGAGGKTLALAAAMDNRGQIFATDSDRGRLAPIYDRLKRAGARNVQVRAHNALDELAGRMDRVLVDAPCTGSGTWRRRPDAKWRITPDAVAKRTAEQDAALAEAACFVRPGGTLAYVTCSLLPIENGARIATFRAAHPDFALAEMHEAWRTGIGSPAPGWLDTDSAWLTPRRSGTDGFFVALLKRVA